MCLGTFASKMQDTGDASIHRICPYLPSARDKGTRYRHELSEPEHVRKSRVLSPKRHCGESANVTN
jgi:hypothetical protein